MRLRHIAAAAAATIAVAAAAAPAAQAVAPATLSTCGVTQNCVWLSLRVGGPGTGTVRMAAQPYLSLDTSTARDIGMDCTRGGGHCFVLVRWAIDHDSTGVLWTATPSSSSVACDQHIDGTKDLGCTAKAGEPRSGAFVLNVHDTRIVDVAGDSVLPLEGRFEKAMRTLVVTKSGTGGGHIGGDAGIDCGATCTTSVIDGTKVTLTARPQDGVRFRQWTGACAGQGATCTLTVDQDMETDAVLELPGPDAKPAPAAAGAPPASAPAPAAAQPVPSPAVARPPLAAKVLSVRRGRRSLAVTLTTSQSAAVDLTLSRGRTVLVRRHVARLADGGQVVALSIPPKLRRGSATLLARITTGAGDVRTLTRTVRLR